MVPRYGSKIKILSERKALQNGVPVSYGIYGLRPKYFKPSAKRFILDGALEATCKNQQPAYSISDKRTEEGRKREEKV